MRILSIILHKVNYTRSFPDVEIFSKTTPVLSVESILVMLIKLVLGAILVVAALLTSIIILPFWLISRITKSLDQKPPLL